MTKRELIETATWVGLGGLVAFGDAELYRHHLPALTDGHRDAIATPLGRAAALICETVVLAHLWDRNCRLSRIDPIHRLAQRLAKST